MDFIFTMVSETCTFPKNFKIAETVTGIYLIQFVFIVLEFLEKLYVSDKILKISKNW